MSEKTGAPNRRSRALPFAASAAAAAAAAAAALAPPAHAAAPRIFVQTQGLFLDQVEAAAVTTPFFDVGYDEASYLDDLFGGRGAVYVEKNWDFNGDRRADFVVAGAGVIDVWLGRARRPLEFAVDPDLRTKDPRLEGACAIALADFNRDDKPDILVARTDKGPLILLNETPFPEDEEQRSNLVRSDKQIVRFAYPAHVSGAHETITTMTEYGPSTRRTWTAKELPLRDKCYGADAADVNRDGNMDVWIANDGVDRVLLGDGLGHFTESAQPFMLEDDSSSVAFAFVDDDDHIDAFVTNNAGGNVVYRNDGTGRFIPFGGRVGDEDHEYTGVAAADFNADGRTDFVLSVFDDDLESWVNDGGGDLDEEDEFGSDDGSYVNVAYGNFSANGGLDVITSRRDGETDWWGNDGGANFTRRQTLHTSESFAVLAGDFDGDYDDDVIVIGGRKESDENDWHRTIIYENRMLPLAVNDSYGIVSGRERRICDQSKNDPRETASCYLNRPVPIPYGGVMYNDVLDRRLGEDGVTLRPTVPAKVIPSADFNDGPFFGIAFPLDTGGFLYVPQPGFEGIDFFAYYVEQGGVRSPKASVRLVVMDSHAPPVAVSDYYRVAEDSVLTAETGEYELVPDFTPAVLFNDFGLVEPIVILDTPPEYGRLTIDPAGSFIYEPPANFTGTVTFTYHLSDLGLESDPVSVSIEVYGNNSDPEPHDDEYWFDVDDVFTPLAVTAAQGVLSNDVDQDGDALIVELADPPAAGTVALAADGSFVYTALASLPASDAFTYVVKDPTRVGDELALPFIAALPRYTVTLNVRVGDAAPELLEPGLYLALRGRTLNVDRDFGLLQHAADADDPVSALRVELQTPPAHGTVVLRDDGSFLYTPEDGFHGVDAFVIRVTDNYVSTEHRVDVVVISELRLLAATPARHALDAAPDAPIVLDFDTPVDLATVAAGVRVAGRLAGPVTFSAAADGNRLVLTPARPFAAGEVVTVALLAPLRDVYGGAAPAPQLWSFHVGGPPATAGLDRLVFLPSATSAYGHDGCVADVDRDGDLDVVVVGTFDYSPTLGWYDLHVMINGGGGTFTPFVQSGTHRPNNSIEAVQLTCGDLDGDGDVDGYVGFNYSGGGSAGVAINDGSGRFTYTAGATPAAATMAWGSSLGDVDLDGDLDVVSPTVTHPRVLENDGSGRFIDGGAVATADEVERTALADLDGDGDLDVLYTAYPGDRGHVGVLLNDGTGRFEDQGLVADEHDGQLTAGDLDGDADVDLVLLGARYPPAYDSVHLNDGAAAFAGGWTRALGSNERDIVISALADFDGDGDLDLVRAAPFDYVYGQDQAMWLNDGHGAFAAGGGLARHPQARSIWFEAADLDGDGAIDVAGGGIDSNTGFVVFNKRLAEAVADVYATDEDVALAVAAPGVLGNDPPVAGGALAAALVTGPAHGTLALGADGAFTYTPHAHWYGEDRFSYRATNTAGASPAAAVTITVAPVNDPPVAADDAWEIIETQSLTVAAPGVLVNDSDPIEGSTIELVQGDPPAHGTLALSAAGGLLYVPAAGFVGVDTFTYAVSDGDRTSAPATVSVRVWPLLEIVDRTPAPLRADAAAAGRIDVRFDTAIDAATAAANVRVVGAQTGPRAPVVTAAGDLSTLDPVVPFAPGERVTVSVYTGLRGLDGARAIHGTMWQFDAIAPAGHGRLVDTGQRLGGSFASAVASGDLDGDLDPDLFIVKDGQPDEVWRNDGQGGFTDSGVRLGYEDGRGVALGDLDRDGRLDALVVNDAQPAALWLGRAGAQLVRAAQVLPAPAATGVALADLDGDGDLDAFVSAIGGSRVWLGGGDGTLSDSGQVLFAGMTDDAAAVALGDLDGDRDVDAAVGDRFRGTTIWLNDGAARFTPAGPEIGDADVSGVVLGDLDGDRDLDVFAAARSGNRVLINGAGGAFADSGQAVGSAENHGAALGDVDRDGDLDAVAAAGSEGSRAWINDGRGRFVTGLALSAGAGDDAAAVVLRDVSGDGRVDVVVADHGVATRVWIGAGTGAFTDSGARLGDNRGGGNLSAGVMAAAVGDLDRDGRLDVVTASDGWSRVWLGAAGARFTATEQRLGDTDATDVALGDLDGDGDLDAIITSTELSLTATRVWLGDGAGGFVVGTGTPFLDQFTAVALGDLDGDGDLDAFMGGERADRVWLNNGSASFAQTSFAFGADHTADVALGDLDGDGDLDAFLVTADDAPDRVLLNTGAGAFYATGQLLGTHDGRAAGLGDFDRDGDLDVYVVNINGPAQIWLGDGRGGFVEGAQEFPIGSREGVAVVDMNADDRLDLVVASASTDTRDELWLGNGDGTFSRNGQALDRGLGGRDVVVGDFDGDGDPDAWFARGDEGDRVWRNRRLPVVVDDTVTLREDDVAAAGAPGLLANDVAGEDPGLVAVLVTPPLHGDVVLGADGAFTYTPDPDFAGLDTLVYQAIAGDAASLPGRAVFVVEAQNDAPAARDDAYALQEDATLAIAAPGLLGNDGDGADAGAGGAAAISAVLLSPPAHGALRFAADGAFEYTPAADFHGADSFTYLATDGAADSAAARVTIAVANVPDRPQAIDDLYELPRGELLVLAPPGLLANDDLGDGAPPRAVVDRGPFNGELVVAPDGGLRYAPESAFTGTDVFTYRADDGVAGGAAAFVRIAVLPLDPALHALAARFATAEDTALAAAVTVPAGATARLTAATTHGALVLRADGTFTYTPHADFHGVDAFTFRLRSAAGDSRSAVVAVDVEPRDDPPAAADDAYEAAPGAALHVRAPGVLANDRDPVEGDALAAALDAPPASGTLALAADGSFVYTPAAGFTGDDAFTYRAVDAGGAASAPARVSLRVPRPNAAPVAEHERYGFVVADPAAPVTVGAAEGVLANDRDADGDALTAVLRVDGLSGTVALAPDGGFTYTPRVGAGGATGDDAFFYEASDGRAASALAHVTLRLRPTTPPSAGADAYVTAEDAVLTVAAAQGVLANDHNGDRSEPFTAALLTAPAHGTLALAADGGFVYTPAPGWHGVDGFGYAAFDGTVEAPADVIIDVPPRTDVVSLVVSDTGVTLELDDDVDAATLAAGVKAHGFVSGPLALQAAATGTRAVLTFAPPPRPGDRVSVTVTPALRDVTGGPLDGPRTVQRDVGAHAAAAAFTLRPTSVAATIRAPALGDVDGDGDLDVFLAMSGADRVLVNDGAAAFSDSGQRLGAANTRAAALGDLDGDGDLDAFADRVWLNDGAGVFADAGPGGDWKHVVLGDVDNDGDLDAVGDRVWFNDGAGGFTAGGSAGNGDGVALADVDRDGDLDVFAARGADEVWRNDGHGVFTRGSERLGSAASFAAGFGDFDRDGDLDALSAGSGRDDVWTNDGTGRFPTSTTGAQNPNESLALGDLDGDGDLDAAETIVNAGFIDVMLCDGAGRFVQTNAHGTALLTNVAIGDVDGDGSLDVIATGGSALDAFLNTRMPRVAADAYTTREDAVLAIAAPGVLANDTRGHGATLTAELLDGEDRGTLALAADGAFTYTPEPDFHGTARFSYRAHDGVAPSLSTTIEIVVTSVNDAPRPAADSYVVGAGDVLRVAAGIGVLVNDRDETALTASLVSGPSHGGAVFGADGAFTYTPAPGFRGTDGFVYAANDGALTTHAAVTIAVATGLSVEALDPAGPSIDFDATLDAASIASNVAVFGDLTGRRPLAFDVAGAHLGLGLAAPWQAGELASITLGAGIRNVGGDPLAPPRVWQFRAPVSAASPGTFVAGPAVAFVDGPQTNAGEVHFADFDGDGDLDFAAAGASSGELGQQPAHIGYNNGAARFERTDVPDGLELDALSVADFDGDGDPDIFGVAGEGGGAFLRNDGARRFTVLARPAMRMYIPRAPVGDVDADGDLDLVTADDGGVAPRVWLNDGAGGFTSGAAIVPVDDWPTHAALGDVDGDGDLDLVAGEVRMNVWRNDGSGAFTLDRGYPQPFALFGLALGDLDGDGDLDVFGAHGDGAFVAHNDGAGVFTQSTVLAQRFPSGAALGDLDGDGDLDGLMVRSSLLYILRNTGGALALQSSIAGMSSARFTLADVDRDGTLDVAWVASAGATQGLLMNRVPPSAAAESYAMNEDAVLAVAAPGVRGNDVAGSRGTFTVVVTAPPAHGAVALAGDGGFVYTPAPDFAGTDTFTYGVDDGSGPEDPTVVTITVANLADAPVAATELYTLRSGATLVIGAAHGLLANDGDADAGDTLTAVLVTPPDHGTLTLAANGSFTYASDPAIAGDLAFTYVARDPQGNESAPMTSILAARPPLRVAATAPAHSAHDVSDRTIVVTFETPLDAASVAGNVVVHGSKSGVRAFAAALDGARLILTPAGPTLAVETFTVTLRRGLRGADGRVPDAPYVWQFTTQARRSNSGWGMASQALGNVSPQNATPHMVDLDRDGLIDFALGGRVSNSRAVAIQFRRGNTFVATAQAIASKAEVVAPGDVDGDGDVDLFGAGDAADATVLLRNDGAGVFTQAAAGPTLAAAKAGGLADLDGDGDLDAALCGSAAAVVVWLNDGTGAFSPGPAAAAHTDRPTQLVFGDVDGDADLDVITGSASRILVWANDGTGALAAPSSRSTAEINSLGAGDLDGDGDLDIWAAPNSGGHTSYTNNGLGVFSSRNQLSGPPKYGALGDVEGDGDLDVIGIDNSRNVRVFRNDGTGALSNSGVITTLPVGSLEGWAVFDQEGDGVVEVAVVSRSNGYATLLTGAAARTDGDPDTYAAFEDQPLVVAAPGVLANDVRGMGATLTAGSATAPAHGTVSLASNGAFTYTPAAEFSGTDTFTYVANDGANAAPAAKVTIVVAAVNDAPAAAGEAFDALAGVPLTGAVLGNDSDVEGDALSAVLASAPAHGTVSLAADGTFTYVAAAGYAGGDTFTYRARDAGGAESAEATVSIDVRVPLHVLATPQSSEALVFVLDAAIDAASAEAAVRLDGSYRGAPLARSVTVDGARVVVTPAARFFAGERVTVALSTALRGVNGEVLPEPVAASVVAPVVVSRGELVARPGAVPWAGAAAVALRDVDGDLDLDVLTDRVWLNDGAAAFTDGDASAEPPPAYTGDVTGDLDGDGDPETFPGPAALGDLDGDGSLDAVTPEAVLLNHRIPAIAGESYGLDEDAPLVVAAPGVLANDGDGAAELRDAPAHGTLQLAANGGFVYTPHAHFHGDDAFTYVVDDGVVESRVATVALAIAAVNDAPIAGAEAYELVQTQALAAAAAQGVLANDADPVEGDAVVAQLVTAPSHGAFTLGADGAFAYTPDAAFSGLDHFVYRAFDGADSSQDVTVPLRVWPLLEVVAVTVGDVVTIEYDAELDAASVAGAVTLAGAATGARAPVLSVAGRRLVVDPVRAFVAGERVTVSVDTHVRGAAGDTPLVATTRALDVAARGGGEARVASSQRLSGWHGAAVELTDHDGDGDLDAIVTRDRQPAEVFANDGAGVFIGTGDWLGLDVAPLPGDPEARGDLDGDGQADRVRAAGAAGLMIWHGTAGGGERRVSPDVAPADGGEAADVALGDVDGDGVLDAFVAMRGAPDALWLGTGLGTFAPGRAPQSRMLPGAGAEAGCVSFADLDSDGDVDVIASRVWINDGAAVFAAAEPAPAACAEPDADGLIDLDGDGDLDTFTTGPDTAWLDQPAPVAAADAYETAAGEPLHVAAPGVAGNDDAVTRLELTAPPAHGALAFDGDGGFTYTPAAGFAGADAFEYVAWSGVVASEAAAVTIHVRDGGAPPVAVPDVFTVDEDATLDVAAPGVLANDANATSAALAAAPSHGALTLRADGSFTYAPAASFHGTDTFTYTAARDGAGSAPTAVTLVVRPVLDAPRARADEYATDAGVALSVPVPGVLANDARGDGPTLAALPVLGPFNGTLSLAADGAFVYTPDAGFSGKDAFAYVADDGLSHSAVAAATILVRAAAPPPAPPATADDAFALAEDQPLAIAAPGVLANDRGDAPLDAVLAAPPLRGALALASDGGFLYTPDRDACGRDVFLYRARAAGLASPLAAVALDVACVNDAPDAHTDVFPALEETPLELDVLADDTDVDGGALHVARVGTPRHGAAALAPSGRIAYTPAPHFVGLDFLWYEAADAAGATDRAFVIVDVADAPDAPRVDAGPDADATEGAPFALLARFTDADAAGTFAASIAWGDGTTGTAAVDAAARTAAASHVYADDGVFTAVVTVTDDDGLHGEDALVIAVANQAPTVAAGPDRGADEGAAVRVDGAAWADPGAGDTHTARVAWGDGVEIDATVDAATRTLRGQHAYADNGLFTARVTVRDDDGASGSDAFDVAVRNVAPVASAGAELRDATAGAPVFFSAAAVDPGSADTHTFAWDFGDGAAAAGPSTSHAYAAAGDFTIVLRVEDDDGGAGEHRVRVTVRDDVPVEVKPFATRCVAFAGVDDPYVYDAAAPDEGDGGRYHLAAAPAGMTVDAKTGVVRWVPAERDLDTTARFELVYSGAASTSAQSCAIAVGNDSVVVRGDLGECPQAALSRLRADRGDASLLLACGVYPASRCGDLVLSVGGVPVGPGRRVVVAGLPCGDGVLPRIAGRVAIAQSGVVLRDVEVRGARWGVEVARGSDVLKDVTIDSVVVNGCASAWQAAINLQRVDGARLVNNRLRGCAYGVAFGGRSGNVLVAHNSMVDLTNALYFDASSPGASGVAVRNNVLHAAGTGAHVLAPWGLPAAYTYAGNVAIRSGAAVYASVTPDDARFLRLRADAANPAFSAGVSEPSVPVDFEGEARGARPDAGADEVAGR